MSNNGNRRVVVTGMGALTPIGLNVQDFFENMMKGTSGSATINGFDTSKLDTKFACELKGFDVAKYLDRKTARRLDRYAQYAMAASMQAVDDSGLDTKT